MVTMILAPQLFRVQGHRCRWLARICLAAAITLVVSGPIYPVQETSDFLVLRGLYSNYDYGYSVRIPKGLTALGARPPFPNHGFVIELAKHPKAELDVSASYNAAEWNSFDDAIDAHRGYFRSKVGGEVSITARAATVLGRLKAVRFTMKPKNSPANDPEVREVLLAFRNAAGEVGIVYEIVLTTRRSRYAKDKQLLTWLQRSWTLKVLPK